MANLNKSLFIGRLTRDPELRYIPSGTAVCEFGLAVNREWTSQSGEKQKEVLFIECTAWARKGEVMAQYLKKGSPIFAEGYLKLDEWQADDGSKRSKIKFVVDNFQFLESRRDAQAGGQGDQRQPERDPAREPAREPTPPDHGDGPGGDDDFPLDEDVPF